MDAQQIISSLPLTGVTSDSRQVGEGFLFAAIKGVSLDGEKFIPQAIKAGAIAVLLEEGSAAETPEAVTRIEVPNPRQVIAQIAAAFYQPQPEHVVAITGTDGKTSVAEFIRQLWEGLGTKSASVGTLGVSCNTVPDIPKFPNTTPDPVILHQAFQQLKRAGVNHIAIEASSHGLHQYRLDGVQPKASAFTTFMHDHGDYHPTEAHYFDAKSRLFRALLVENGTAILNADDAKIIVLKPELEAAEHKVVTFGMAGDDYRIISSTPIHDGLQIEIEIKGQLWQGTLPLYGCFQLMNVMTALALIIESDAAVNINALLAQLPTLEGVNGRLQKVGVHSCGAAIFIDYAHTADALKNVLKSLRPHTQGALHVVFGCGGDRDNSKRPLMAKVAQETADEVIVTDDNPRTEDAAAIRAEVMQGCPNAREVAGRKEAIQQAISALKAGDVLLVAGKGHESEQIIGTQVLHHNDAEVILECLKGSAA